MHPPRLSRIASTSAVVTWMVGRLSTVLIKAIIEVAGNMRIMSRLERDMIVMGDVLRSGVSAGIELMAW